MTGAQYIHYAFGLLNQTNTFCPVQAVLHNEEIGMVKECLRTPRVNEAALDEVLQTVKKVMASTHQLFARHVRKAMHAGEVSSPYHFETRGMEDRVLENAWKKWPASRPSRPNTWRRN
jgi:trimethylamine--corrinoid protein Co-methyltransferase